MFGGAGNPGASNNSVSNSPSCRPIHHVVLWVDINVSEEDTASSFRFEVCRFRNRLGYIGKLHGRWS
jgi:hypothetical protein